MRHLPLILVLAPLILAGAAPPRDVPAAATIKARSERPKRVVAGEHVWRCEGGSCRGQASASPVAQAKACRRLAREAGAVLTFEAGGRAMDAAELVACNR